MKAILTAALLALCCCSQTLFAQEQAPDLRTHSEKITSLQAEVDRLKSIVPGQATAMIDFYGHL